ncbi:hypothetical protein [Nocardioides sp.]|uniref:hypothetical protein n=1 Tax=Nocardioides sp. TaxID=35761 RepID=UPI0026258409|nr:hypothetical protein [Nocardioides sp.]MCW2735553.1 hypothetical protein [Nocardioides sp.]
MLTATGRRVRLAVTAVFFGLLLAGTAVGQDDAFPFGPFRMYATRDAPDGLVLSTRVEAVDATGRVVVVPDTATGLRRAEIEGQVGRLRSDPGLLAAISRAHDRLHPDQPAYDEVRVVERRYRLRDSRPTGDQTEQVVARWHR